MIDFLKNFFAGEKSPEEKALLAAQEAPVERDVITVEAYAMEEDEEEEYAEYCSSPCGGCGCRS
jgi:hypothetical protein